MKIKQKFNIDYHYDIYFTEDVFSVSNNTLKETLKTIDPKTSKVGIVIDDNVYKHWPNINNKIITYSDTHHHINYCQTPCIIPGGEQAKNNIKFLEQVLAYINKESLDRHSVIIGIGGGALLDLVGFAAAIGHRGIQHIRIPTTVLAQNDAGVGVKNGINFLNKKNFLGTFSPPMAVINDHLFLNTLNNTHWRAGTSEAVKVALLKDPEFFEWIEQHASELADRNIIAMQELIHRCAKHHTNHIINNNDPFERTSARPLDFGHWAAHKLEQLSSFNLTHGEAVAIGISLDCAYAVQKGLLKKNIFHRIIKTFSTLNFDLFNSQLFNPKQTNINPNLLIGLDEFREHLGGNLTITLIKEIGESFEVNQIDHYAMNRAALLVKEQLTAYAV